MNQFNDLRTGLHADNPPRRVTRVAEGRMDREKIYKMWDGDPTKLADLANAKGMTVPEFMRTVSPAVNERDAVNRNDQFDPFADMLSRDNLRVQSVQDGDHVQPASAVEEFFKTESGRRAFIMRIDDVYDRTLKSLIFAQKASATTGASVDGLDAFENRAVTAPVIQNPFGLPVTVADIAARVDPIPSTRWTRPNILSKRENSNPTIVEEGDERPYVTLGVSEDQGNTDTLAAGVGWTDKFATSDLSMDIVNAEVAFQAQAAERYITNEGIRHAWNAIQRTGRTPGPQSATKDLDGILTMRYYSDGGFNYNVLLGNQTAIAAWSRANILAFAQGVTGSINMLSPTRLTGAVGEISLGNRLSAGPEMFYFIGGTAGADGVDIPTTTIPGTALISLDRAQGLVLKVCRTLETDTRQEVISRGITIRRRTWNFGWDLQKDGAAVRWNI